MSETNILILTGVFIVFFIIAILLRYNKETTREIDLGGYDDLK